MNKIITGKAFVLGENIDTDQIIPAEHLVYSLTDPEESKKYGHYALSGVPMPQAGLPEGNRPFINGDNHTSEFNIIIGGSNFGCGSSREHAPFALQIAGVQVIIAESYARIFYRNSIDGGFLVPVEAEENVNTIFKTGEAIEVNLDNNCIKSLDSGKEIKLKSLGDVFPIIESGGLFEYARKSGMIAS